MAGMPSHAPGEGERRQLRRPESGIGLHAGRCPRFPEVRRGAPVRAQEALQGRAGRPALLFLAGKE